MERLPFLAKEREEKSAFMRPFVPLVMSGVTLYFAPYFISFFHFIFVHVLSSIDLNEE